MTQLQEARNKILTDVSESYQFGNVLVDSMDGWEYSSFGREYSRAVYVRENEEAEFTSKVFLNVVFKDVDSAELEEAYAITQNGNLFGSYK